MNPFVDWQEALWDYRFLPIDERVHLLAEPNVGILEGGLEVVRAIPELRPFHVRVFETEPEVAVRTGWYRADRPGLVGRSSDDFAVDVRRDPEREVIGHVVEEVDVRAVDVERGEVVVAWPREVGLRRELGSESRLGIYAEVCEEHRADPDLAVREHDRIRHRRRVARLRLLLARGVAALVGRLRRDRRLPSR